MHIYIIIRLQNISGKYYTGIQVIRVSNIVNVELVRTNINFISSVGFPLANFFGDIWKSGKMVNF